MQRQHEREANEQGDAVFRAHQNLSQIWIVVSAAQPSTERRGEKVTAEVQPMWRGPALNRSRRGPRPCACVSRRSDGRPFDFAQGKLSPVSSPRIKKLLLPCRRSREECLYA